MTINPQHDQEAYSQRSINALGGTLLSQYFQKTDWEITGEHDETENITQLSVQGEFHQKLIFLVTKLHNPLDRVYLNAVDSACLIELSRACAIHKKPYWVMFVTVNNDSGRPQIAAIEAVKLEFLLTPMDGFDCTNYVRLSDPMLTPLPVSEQMAMTAAEYMAEHSAVVELPF